MRGGIRGIRAALTRTGAPMNLIGNALIQRRLADKLQLKEFSPAPTLAPEIQAVVLVDDMTKADREETQRIVSIGAASAAVPAQNATWQVFNPLNSGVTIRVRWIMTGNPDSSGATTQHWLVGLTSNSIGGSQACPIWNTRRPTIFGQATLGLQNQVGVPGASQIADYYQTYLTPPTKLELDGLIIPPGWGLNVSNAAINQASSFTAAWIEEDTGR